MIRDRARARAISEDYASAGVSTRECAILDYAVKLTTRPKEMAPEDVELLRAAGLKDDEILDVCQVTAYFNYVNRLADGLGVELEPYWKRIPE